MLIEKEIISPGTYWYTDKGTGIPRKLSVTPDLTRYWFDQGSKMLSAGLTVPVPYEHDFESHPMTPKDKLLNNAGWVKEYRLKGDKLFGVVDVQDDDVARKLPRTIRWTSPWINSFTDGTGRRWTNVISHLALTTRPRVIKQTPFGSIAAALSIANPVEWTITPSDSTRELSLKDGPEDGFCLTRAGRLVTRKKDNVLRPQYPIAFSLISGSAFLDNDMPTLTDDGDDVDVNSTKSEGPVNPLNDNDSDVKMEELLCDLLNALGVQMPENVGKEEFKRVLYEATMSKIRELTDKAQKVADKGAQQSNSDTTSPSGGSNDNPLIDQEQQPMYMSLEDINKLTEPMRSVALSMYQENARLRAEMDSARKMTESLRDARLREAGSARATRIALLGKLSPRVKGDLEAMSALPSMALSMGDGGNVVDPMDQTLTVLEKGMTDVPRLLKTDSSSFVEVPQPTDDEISAEASDKLADSFARMMGCPPGNKAG